MRWWAIVVCVLGPMLAICSAARAADAEGDAELKARVERIVIELADLNPATREQADAKLRNLPLPAYPIVMALNAKEKDSLDVEARSRIDSAIDMFKVLTALDQRARNYWGWIKTN